MRIISQEGYIDVAYEPTGISIGWNADKSEYYIYGNGLFYNTRNTLAKYSSVEKAIKAMKMLHEVYEHGKYIPYLKLDKSKIAKDDDMTLHNHEMAEKLFPSGFHSQVKVFQFPQDDEIEV
jgi:hypothetical protein